MFRLLRLGLGCLLLLTCLENSEGAVKQEAKVIILGAGMSGVMAAKTLKENGMDDFVVLEGGSDIAGRLMDGSFLGYQVEVGSEFIDGACLNQTLVDLKVTDINIEGCSPIFALANKHGIDYTPVDYDDDITRDRGGADVTELADVEYEAFYSAHDKSSAMAVDALARHKPDTSVEVGLRMSGWRADNPLKRAVEHFEIDFESGQPTSLTSLKHSILYSYEHFGQHELYIRGDKGLKDIIVETAVEMTGGDISVPEPVLDTTTSPIFQTDTVVRKISQDDDKVTVTTTNGDVFVGDYVLVTFSIGVLQSGDVIFEPALPQWKMDSIHEFQMSYYTTIILQFPSPFWDDVEWILYADETDGRYPIWLNMNKIYTGCNILRVTVTGEEARRVQEMADLEIWHELRVVLRSMYGNIVPTKKPTMYLSRFSKSPLFRGSFSNWPIGYPEEYHEALKHEVGRVFFAGEAMSYDYFGTVTGAYFAGVQQAKKLLHCMSNKCPAFVPYYDAGGCTYNMAINYNAKALYDDGTCQLCSCTSGVSILKSGGSFTLPCLSVMFMLFGTI